MEREIKKVFNHALRLLARRDFSIEELREKLKRKNFEDPVISRVLEICLERSYINEEERASQLLRKSIYKAKGPLYLQMELKKLKIPEKIIEENLNKLRFEYQEELMARAFDKKLSRIRSEDIRKNKADLFRFLLSQGFASRDISDFMQKLPEERFLNKS